MNLWKFAAVKTLHLWKGKVNMEPKTYKVTKIDGDYAHLVNIENGEDMLIARALIPEESDEGTTLYWENFTYTVVE